MSTATTTKFQLGAAALAVAAATAAIAPVAQADFAPQAPALPSIAQAVAGDDWWLQDGASAQQEANAGLGFAIQTPFFAIGFIPDADVPAGFNGTDGTIFSFDPLALPLLGGIWGSIGNNFNTLEVCLLGATLRVGPYGSVAGKFTMGC